MKYLACLAAMMALSGCATYSPGDDPLGQKLQVLGAPVLEAAREYMDSNARYPRSIQELVPKYLAAIPDEPKVYFDVKGATFLFKYKQEDHGGLPVVCHALIGQTEWVCAISQDD